MYLPQKIYISSESGETKSPLPHYFELIKGHKIISQNDGNLNTQFFVLHFDAVNSSERFITVYQPNPFRFIRKFYVKNLNIKSFCFFYDLKIVALHLCDKIRFYDYQGEELFYLLGEFSKVEQKGDYLVVLDKNDITTVYKINSQVKVKHIQNIEKGEHPSVSDQNMNNKSIESIHQKKAENKEYVSFESFFNTILKFRGNFVEIHEFFIITAVSKRLSIYVDDRCKLNIIFDYEIQNATVDPLLSKIYALCDNRIYVVDLCMSKIKSEKLKTENSPSLFDIELVTKNKIERIFCSKFNEYLYVLTCGELLIFDYFNESFLQKIDIAGINDLCCFLDIDSLQNSNDLDLEKILAQN